MVTSKSLPMWNCSAPEMMFGTAIEGPGHVFLVNGTGEHHLVAKGNVGYPYFGRLILDCLERTENAMTQEHAFKAAELSVQAQLAARVLTPDAEGAGIG